MLRAEQQFNIAELIYFGVNAIWQSRNRQFKDSGDDLFLTDMRLSEMCNHGIMKLEEFNFLNFKLDICFRKYRRVEVFLRQFILH